MQGWNFWMSCVPGRYPRLAEDSRSDNVVWRMQGDQGELLYCRMSVDNRPPADMPVYRARDVELRAGELSDVLSSELFSFRSGRSLQQEVMACCHGFRNDGQYLPY